MITISIPGCVYDEALRGEPLGLPDPTVLVRHRGQTVVYRNLRPELARGLATYLDARSRLGLMNAGTYDNRTRVRCQRMRAAARQIEKEVDLR